MSQEKKENKRIQKKYHLIGSSKWQRRFRERDQFREEYDIPDGDIQRGEFLYQNSCCVGCHSVDYEYNHALPLELIYKYRTFMPRFRNTSCNYEWNRNRIYSILWQPHVYFSTDYDLDSVDDSQDRADIAEYITHLKYSYTPQQKWHHRY